MKTNEVLDLEYEDKWVTICFNAQLYFLYCKPEKEALVKMKKMGKNGANRYIKSPTHQIDNEHHHHHHQVRKGGFEKAKEENANCGDDNRAI